MMVTKDDILARLGLESRRTATDYIMPALGVFGAGMLVGAGLGLMFAPKRGVEIRHDLGEGATRIVRGAGNFAGRLRRRRQVAGDEHLEEFSREELYQRAQEMEIEGRSEMTKAELIDAISHARN